MELNHYSPPTSPPSFYELLNAARDNGLVGEEDTVLTLILSMLRGNLIVMTGPSRAGKDVSVDAAEGVFNTEKMVYRWPVDDSATAAYYNAEEINSHPIHRFPDLARLEEHHEKILKAFGEGRDATRDVTDIAAEKRGDKATRDQTIKCPKTVIAFIATDNENVDLNDFPELRNRALLLSVDASEQQTNKVNRRKAEEYAGVSERAVDPMRVAEIQSYMSSVPVDEWDDSLSNKIVNPAAINIHEQQPIPEKFPEARQDFERLLEFMQTAALYHYGERLVYDGNGQRTMLVAPTDVWETMTIIGNKMVMSALNMTREDHAVIDLLEEARANMTKADIQQQLRKAGLHVTDKDVRRSLKSMRLKGYVQVHQGNPNTFSFSDFGSVVHHEAGFDYEEIVDAAAENVYELVSDEAADKYVEEFCEGTGLITTHPFTGEAVDIREADELSEILKERTIELENVFDRRKSGSDSGAEGSPSEETDDRPVKQGTLT